ncbi:hypothetical protein [Saccharomonospora iraqiensis]|uniref:hypothetical protein n=1 Tax=Saccharomonospora iraqiensis TaxID=52698 RepID=UPI00022E6E94|nr:hypothetical protein [Saccharomonospora iraqiensis]
MPIRDAISPAPREVRLAGALTALPGFALLAFGVLVALNAGASPLTGVAVAAEAAYFGVLAAGVLACAVGLLLGRTWARSPAVVVSLILTGVGWYATGPSDQPGFGIPVMAAGVAVLVLLFRRASRAWVLGQTEDETEEEASRRGGAAGRRAEREHRDGDRNR